MKDILKEVIVNIVVAIIMGIFAYLWGKLRGKKQSTEAIKRKETLYIPIDDEIINFRNNYKDIVEKIDFPITFSVVDKIYRYEIDKNITNKILELKENVGNYNKINIVSIVSDIIQNRFITIFEELFGSIIEDSIISYDYDGNEYETDIYCEEYESLKYILEKDIKSLIINRNYPEYLISDIQDITHKDLVNIYSGCFNITINGTPIKKRTIPNWQGTVPEFFAYNTNFIEEFNNNPKIQKKNELLKEIKQQSLDIKNKMEHIISKITKLYEKEII